MPGKTAEAWSPLKIVVSLAAIAFGSWPVRVFADHMQFGFTWFASSAASPLLMLSILLATTAFFGNDEDSREIIILSSEGAVFMGVIGMAVGIFLAAIYAPHSNIAPAVAFLVTGPVGGAAGAVIGAIIAVIRAHDRQCQA